MTMNERVNELEEYVRLGNDEFSEQNELLLQLYRYRDGLTDGFKKELSIQLASNLKWYKENTEIVEQEETETNTHRWKELVYKMNGY